MLIRFIIQLFWIRFYFAGVNFMQKLNKHNTKKHNGVLKLQTKHTTFTLFSFEVITKSCWMWTLVGVSIYHLCLGKKENPLYTGILSKPDILSGPVDVRFRGGLLYYYCYQTIENLNILCLYNFWKTLFIDEM